MTAASYLDHNATTPMLESVVDAMVDAMRHAGNPSSVHRFGRAARRMVDAAREQVAAAVNAKAADVVFTGSGTEANNLALQGASRGAVLASAIEHDSVLRASDGIVTIPVRRDGRIDLDALERLLAEHRPALVSVMLANNETGVIQPVAEASRLSKAAGALVHCDAIQALGRIDVDVEALGADLLSLSAHKIGGPQGVGALIVRENVTLQPIMAGGGQERRRRPGTENIAGIVGFGVATKHASDHLNDSAALAGLRDAAQSRLTAMAPTASVFGAGAPRLPNTLCIEMPGVGSEAQVMAFDIAGIAISAGSACSSGKMSASHVLRAMGVDDASSSCAIRVSFGRGNSMADVDRLAQAWGALLARRGVNRNWHVTAA